MKNMISNQENDSFALFPILAFFVDKILLMLVLIVLLAMHDLFLNLGKISNSVKEIYKIDLPISSSVNPCEL